MERPSVGDTVVRTCEGGLHERPGWDRKGPSSGAQRPIARETGGLPVSARGLPGRSQSSRCSGVERWNLCQIQIELKLSIELECKSVTDLSGTGEERNQWAGEIFIGLHAVTNSYMPISLDDHDPDIGLTPGTTKSDIIAFLYQNDEYGYSPREVHEALDIPHSTAKVTLKRLYDNEFIEKTPDGYYHARADRDDLYRYLGASNGLI